MNDKCFSSLGSNEATLLQAEAREKVKELRKPEWKKLTTTTCCEQRQFYRLKAGGLEEAVAAVEALTLFQAASCFVVACVLLLVTYFFDFLQRAAARVSAGEVTERRLSLSCCQLK